MGEAAEKIYSRWDDRWKKTKKNSFIGKKMFTAKKEALKNILEKVEFSTALDVGCGSGYLLEVFKNTGKEVKGIDVSESAVKACKSRGLPATQERLEDIDKTYDLVFSDGLLEHFLALEFYVRQLIRVSSKYIMIIQTNHESSFIRFSLWLETLLKKDVNVYEYNYRIQDFIDIFEKNGCKLIEKTGIFSRAFFLLVFKK